MPDKIDPETAAWYRQQRAAELRAIKAGEKRIDEADARRAQAAEDEESTTEQALTAARAEVERLRGLLQMILLPVIWNEKGHPGRACHRTEWVEDAMLAKWRKEAGLDDQPSTRNGA
jgi:hypothetical protein